MKFLKRVIKQTIINSAVIVTRIIKKISSHGGHIYVLPPAPPGSLGDEALLLGLFNLLSEKNRGSRPRIAIFPGWDHWDCPGFDQQVITAGTIWNIGATLRFIFALLSCRHFTVLGADVMDGKYSPEQVMNTVMLCNLAVKIGVPATIFGFSFCDIPNPKAVAALRELDSRVICLCRDAVSLERFLRETQHSADLVADLAFHMKPNLESAPAVNAAQWVKAQRDDGKRVLGINANTVTVEGNSIDIVQAYVRELTKILEEHDDIVCLMLPHDLRGGQSDYETLKRIAEFIPQLYKTRIHLLAPPFDARDVKALAGALELLVAGRMHLIIGALAQSVPSVGITYQGKFEGLYAFFDCTDLLFEPAGLANPGQLANFVSTVLPKLDGYKTKITKALPKVLDLSARNVEHI